MQSVRYYCGTFIDFEYFEIICMNYLNERYQIFNLNGLPRTVFQETVK